MSGFVLHRELFLQPVISDTQIAVDNLSEVSEGRKIIYTGLISLLFFSYFPFMDVKQDIGSFLSWIAGKSNSF